MVYQDIIISPDILEIINNSYCNIENDIDIKSYKNNLDLKKIILDKEGNLDLEYKKIINQSTDLGKQQLDSILKSFLLNGRFEYKTLSTKLFSSNKINNILFSLALSTIDKIINSNSRVIKNEKISSEHLKNIEILNIDEIIKPPSESRCFSLERTIKRNRGDRIEFQKLLNLYLVNTKCIKVFDKFLKKRKEAVENLLKMLKCCKNLKHLTIYTNLSYHHEDYIKNNDLINTISNIIRIRPVMKSNSKHRRIIETDRFRIAIDPGLDFVNDKLIAEKHDVEINISPLNL